VGHQKKWEYIRKDSMNINKLFPTIIKRTKPRQKWFPETSCLQDTLQYIMIYTVKSFTEVSEDDINLRMSFKSFKYIITNV